MDDGSRLQCPRCHSTKYSSLPFDLLVGGREAARTFRCLLCGGVFYPPAPARRARRPLEQPVA